MALGPASDKSAAAGRQRLATIVVTGSFLTIFLLVAMLLAIAQLGGTRASDLAEQAFNAVLPVLASWVGTVLAFFFSAQSLERTSSSLDTAIRAAGGGGDGKTVSQDMIPFDEILQLVDLRKIPAKELTLSDLQARFSQPTGSADDEQVPKVTRLVFTDGNIFRYVMHIATLNAFLVKVGTTTNPKLEDLLSDPTMLRQISRLVVFVAANASLTEARTLMERVDGAQDIIVTPTGNSSEPMLGWITNVDLVRELNGQ